MKAIQKVNLLAIFLVALVSVVACEKAENSSEVFVKAEPGVDTVLNRPPRSLRIFLTELPDTSKSSVKLFGEQGELSLSHFHTMGANDLMIEVDDHPLPNGKYRVEWTATVGDDKRQYSGKFEFAVAVEK